MASLENTYTTDENAVPWQLVDRQFKLLTAFCPVDGQYQSALRISNQCKNRNFDFLPLDATRVSLVPRANADGSDYINATWLPGFVHLNEFIVTQHPMQQTVSDFWRMIWEHNVRTMVVLSPNHETVHILHNTRLCTLFQE